MARTDGDGTPDLLGTIIGILGYDATLRLVEEFGGTRVFVPAKPTERSRVAQAIGLASAQLLAREFSGLELRVPAPQGAGAS